MDLGMIEALDNEIERKKRQIEQLGRELTTLVEARRILTEGKASIRQDPSAEDTHRANSTTRRTIVDDILRILNVAERDMTPVEIRQELSQLGRDVPQPVITSTLVRLQKVDRVWKVGPARYAAKKSRARQVLDKLSGASDELSPQLFVTVANGSQTHEQ